MLVPLSAECFLLVLRQRVRRNLSHNITPCLEHHHGDGTAGKSIAGVQVMSVESSEENRSLPDDKLGDDAINREKPSAKEKRQPKDTVRRTYFKPTCWFVMA